MRMEDTHPGIRAEIRLSLVARKALDVKTHRATRARVGQLFHLSQVFAPIVAGLELTADPFEIARNHLVTVASDGREYANFDIDPTDAYSQDLAKKQQRLGYALGVLARQAEKSSSEHYIT